MTWTLAGRELDSRLLIGSARYRALTDMGEAVRASGAQVVTVALRREDPREQAGQRFWAFVKDLGVHVLPNTAGCHTVAEAVTTAEMAREVFETDWVKLELIGDTLTLQPDPILLVEAAAELVGRGFQVLPYTTEDLVVARRLVEVGCTVLMPWGAPIGSGQGIQHPDRIATLRDRFPDVTLLVDAGIGKPSHAAAAMELGCDGVLLNTAIARADDPVTMARAFAAAVEAGRLGYEAGAMQPLPFAEASTPVVGTPFWHRDGS